MGTYASQNGGGKNTMSSFMIPTPSRGMEIKFWGGVCIRPRTNKSVSRGLGGQHGWFGNRSPPIQSVKSRERTSVSNPSNSFVYGGTHCDLLYMYMRCSYYSPSHCILTKHTPTHTQVLLRWYGTELSPNCRPKQRSEFCVMMRNVRGSEGGGGGHAYDSTCITVGLQLASIPGRLKIRPGVVMTLETGEPLLFFYL